MKQDDIACLVCPRCGKVNAPKAPFCVTCGMPLSELESSENLFHGAGHERPQVVSPFSYWALRLVMISAILTNMIFLAYSVISGDFQEFMATLLLMVILIIYSLYFFKMTKHPILDKEK